MIRHAYYCLSIAGPDCTCEPWYREFQESERKRQREDGTMGDDKCYVKGAELLCNTHASDEHGWPNTRCPVCYLESKLTAHRELVEAANRAVNGFPHGTPDERLDAMNALRAALAAVEEASK